MKGKGHHGAVVVAGDLIGSSLFQLITLPADDEDIMPPKGDPLTEIQAGLIRNWINQGAKPEAVVEVAQKEAPKEDKEGGVLPNSFSPSSWSVVPIVMVRTNRKPNCAWIPWLPP